jgi:hypothetical protein
LCTTQIFTGTGNPLTVSGNGEMIFFVDADSNLRVINSDGSAEQVVSNNGSWKSLALSPDGSKLALTRMLTDTTISILNLVDSSASKTLLLSKPGTLYANALD